MKPLDWNRLLEPGEALLWAGRPYPAFALIRPSQAEWLIGALGAVGVAAVLLLRQVYPPPPEPDAMRLALVLLGLFGTLFFAGVPFRAMRARSKAFKRMNYAVTDRRAMAVDVRDPHNFRQYRIPKKAEPQVEPEDHGLATLHFGGESPRFQHIRDAGAIAELIRKAR
ncbi:MAG: hypothetical protein P3W90_005190 [Paracoccus sp. (in: a-proteobacteria)]|nr:hypothetical protein [Paracoccus sp. (in: a-proteobacteria)]